jgi:hypothetical protein
MARLREYWLETLMTCATAVMLAFTYNVLAGYATGPVIAAQHAPSAQVAQR